MHTSRRSRYFQFAIASGLLLISVGFSQASLAAASGGGRGSLGLMTGVALPSSGDTAFLLGFKAEIHALSFVRTALFFNTFGSSVTSSLDASSVTASTHTTMYGLEGSVNLDADISFGVKCGLLKSSSDVRASDGAANSVVFNSSASGLFLGPTLMYEQPLGRFAMTAELGYALVLSSQLQNSALLALGVKYLF